MRTTQAQLLLLSLQKSVRIQPPDWKSEKVKDAVIDARGGTRTFGPWTTLLLQFCRKPDTADYASGNPKHDDALTLSNIKAVFPDIEQQIKGKRVVDFGCGSGYQAVAYARAGAREVVGVEIVEHLAELSADRARQEGVADIVRIERHLSEPHSADVIISTNSFEHFIEPEAIMNQFREALAPGGRALITFGPPWFAPTGAHMSFFCRLPWVQLLFPESAVMQARTLYRTDTPVSYIDAGIGKISVARFERIIRTCGLKMSWYRYDCVKGLDFLQHLPGIRELFINRVSCILETTE